MIKKWEKADKFKNLCQYFIFAVVIFGSAGIWLPAIIDSLFGEFGYTDNSHKNVLQNITTYFLSIIVAASYVRIAIIHKSDYSNKVGRIFAVVGFFSIALFAVVFNSIFIYLNEIKLAEYIAIAGILFAFYLWWRSNWGSEQMNPLNSLD